MKLLSLPPQRAITLLCSARNFISTQLSHPGHRALILRQLPVQLSSIPLLLFAPALHVLDPHARVRVPLKAAMDPQSPVRAPLMSALGLQSTIRATLKSALGLQALVQGLIKPALGLQSTVRALPKLVPALARGSLSVPPLLRALAPKHPSTAFPQQHSPRASPWT